MTKMPFKLQLTFALFIFSLGCSDDATGPQKYAVDGFLMMDEKPVGRASLSFIPDAASGNAGPAAFASVKGGEFAMTAKRGLVAGKSKVEITVYADDAPAGSEAALGTISQFVTITADGENLLSLDVQSGDLKAGGSGEDGEGEDESEEDD